jgi:hypothetical protein
MPLTTRVYHHLFTGTNDDDVDTLTPAVGSAMAALGAGVQVVDTNRARGNNNANGNRYMAPDGASVLEYDVWGLFEPTTTAGMFWGVIGRNVANNAIVDYTSFSYAVDDGFWQLGIIGGLDGASSNIIIDGDSEAAPTWQHEVRLVIRDTYIAGYVDWVEKIRYDFPAGPAPLTGAIYGGTVLGDFSGGSADTAFCDEFGIDEWEGPDPTWVEIDTVPENEAPPFTATGLPVGHHQFRVVAENADGETPSNVACSEVTAEGAQEGAITEDAEAGGTFAATADFLAEITEGAEAGAAFTAPVTRPAELTEPAEADASFDAASTLPVSITEDAEAGDEFAPIASIATEWSAGAEADDTWTALSSADLVPVPPFTVRLSVTSRAPGLSVTSRRPTLTVGDA